MSLRYYPNVKPSRKDRVIVIGLWLLLVFVVRTALIATDPDHSKWAGAVAALPFSFLIVLAAFNFEPFKQYKPRFAKVIRYWFGRGIKRQIPYMCLTAVSIAAIVTLQHGHEIYDPKLTVWEKMIANGTDDAIVKADIAKTFEKASPYDQLAMITMITGPAGDEGVNLNWMIVYQEAQYWIFAAVIRYMPRVFGLA